MNLLAGHILPVVFLPQHIGDVTLWFVLHGCIVNDLVIFLQCMPTCKSYDCVPTACGHEHACSTAP